MTSTATLSYRRTSRIEVEPLTPAQNFEEWVRGRTLPSPSTNAGAPPLPFQGWHRFKEAFSPELVAMAVAGSSRDVKRLCDPFGGSGTSGLAAQFMGIDSVSIEVNPFLADLISAKVENYDTRELLSALPRVARRAKSTNISDLSLNLPPTFVEPGKNGRWLFDTEVASEIVRIRKAIEQEENPKIRRLMKVLLGGNLVEFSNAVVSGKGRRYRRAWNTRRADPSLVLERFCDAVAKAIVEIDAHSNKPSASANVLHGDSRELILEAGTSDLVVCSPPYPNSFDYTDVYNIELWMLGYLQTAQDNWSLRSSTLSSHVQIKRNFLAAPKTSILENVMSDLAVARNKLWDRNLVEMVGGYFADLNILLAGCHNILESKGQIWLVVGDSQYAGIRIPVADILSELGVSLGLKTIRLEPFRSMRLSPQQGGSQQLAESLVVLAKD